MSDLGIWSPRGAWRRSIPYDIGSEAWVHGRSRAEVGLPGRDGRAVAACCRTQRQHMAGSRARAACREGASCWSQGTRASGFGTAASRSANHREMVALSIRGSCDGRCRIGCDWGAQCADHARPRGSDGSPGGGRAGGGHGVLGRESGDGHARAVGTGSESVGGMRGMASGPARVARQCLGARRAKLRGAAAGQAAGPAPMRRRSSRLLRAGCGNRDGAAQRGARAQPAEAACHPSHSRPAPSILSAWPQSTTSRPASTTARSTR